MNLDETIDRLLDAYRKNSSETVIDPQCQALIDTLRDPDRMQELVAQADSTEVLPFETRKFGEFELTGWVGAGGMGQVYRAVHAELGREQALKMLPPERVTDAHAMSRFKREIRAIGQLNHPSIVTVYDAGQVDGTPYLTMELIEGRSLSEVVRDARQEGRKVDVNEACRLIADAADGIQHAHENGVLHRDIKPGNLMLDTQGRLRILDLGLAKFVDASQTSSIPANGGDEVASNLTEEQLTAAQQILGTPDYMSPEQITSVNDVDARSDVYSLAATLYYLLTGEAVFVGSRSNLLSKAVAVLQTPAPRVSEKRGDLPEGLDDAIAKALSKNPDDRPQSAAEFAAILRPYAIPTAEPVAKSKPQVSSASSPPLRRAALWLLALLPLGAALAGLLMVLNGPDGSTLRIESDDPDVKVIATWAGETNKNAASSPMQIEATPGKPATLRAGHWIVSIDGDQRGQYELSQTELILKDGETKRLVVTRTLSKAVATPIEPTTIPPRTSTSVVKTSKSRPSDAELLKRFDAIDLKPGEQEKRHHGEVAQPGLIDGIPNWQLQSTFPVGGELVNVSPKGTYLVVKVPNSKDYFVYLRETGRMHGVLDAGSRFHSVIAWSPDETRLLVMNEKWLPQGRVFGPDGEYLHDWKNEQTGNHLYWTPDGKQVLVANGTTMQMRTAKGDLIESFVAPKHGNPESRVVQPWSPDGTMFAFANKGTLAIYVKDGGDPILQTPCAQWTQFAWHPSGKYVVYHDQEDLCLCTVDGQIRSITKGDYLHDDLTWSPDGKFVITGGGAIYDLSGTKVSQIDLPYGGGLKGNLLRWYQDKKLTVFSRCEPGSFVEMTPTGKIIREVERPVPLPFVIGNWSKDKNQMVSCFPATYDYPFKKRWIFDWDESGAGASIEFGESIGSKVGHTLGAQTFVGWNPVESLFSYSDTDGVHTFDLTGKRVSHLEKERYVAQATWSPDGKKLAVAFLYEGDVVVYENGKPRNFSFDDDKMKRLQWLANSKQAVVDFADSDRFAVISLDDTEQTEFRSRCVNPVSPSGQWTVIADKPEGKSNLVILRPAMGEARELAFKDTDFTTWQCFWNHDETELVLIGNYHGSERATVYHYNVQARRLSKRDTTEWYPDAIWNNDRFMYPAWDSLRYRSENGDELATIPVPRKGGSAIFARGRQFQTELGDGNPVSPDGRFISLILNGFTHQSQEHGGNLCVVDLQEKKVAWTGIAFNDGNRAIIDNVGRVREVSDDRFDEYLTYTIAYTGNQDAPPRFVPLTRLQFAARIGLSKPQQTLQTVLDLGGRLTLSEQRTLTTADVVDARDLPSPDEVIGVVLADNRYLTDSIVGSLTNLPTLRELNLSGTTLTTTNLPLIRSLPELRTLNVSGMKIDDGFSHALPDSIEELDVSGTSIGDFFLFDLGAMKSLRKLNLTGTSVTANGVRRLQKRLPECEILFGNAKNLSTIADQSGRISDKELLARLDAIDWKPGTIQDFDGYAATPTDLPSIEPGRWQVITPYPHSTGACVISPKGNYLTASYDRFKDSYLRVIDRRTGKLVGILRHKSTANYGLVRWSPDESKLIVLDRAGSKFSASVFRRNGVLINRWTTDLEAYICEWSPDGSRILLANQNVMEQRTPEGVLVESFQAPQHGFDTAAHLQRHTWSPDGSQFAGVIKNELYVYDSDGGTPVAVIKAEKFDYAGVLWHPSGEKLLTSDGRLWNLAGDHMKLRLDREREQILAFSPDGRHFVTNHGDIRDLTDRVVSTLDVSEMGYVHGQDARWVDDDVITFFSPASRGLGFSIDYSPSGKVLAKWDHPAPMPQHSFNWKGNEDRFVSFANPLITNAHVPARRFQWDVASSDGEDAIAMSRVTYGPASFSPQSNRTLLSFDAINCTLIHDATGKVVQEIDGLGTAPLRSWSPDGKRFAAGGGHHLKFIDVYEGPQKIGRLEMHDSQPRGVQWSSNGNFICVWTDDQKVYIWDFEEPNRPIAERDGVGFGFYNQPFNWSTDRSSPRWSPDGSRLAIPSKAAVLLVSPSGEEDISLPWDESSMGTIWWHPDGKKLIAGNVVIDVESKTSTAIVGADHPMHFVYWIDQDRFVGADRTSVIFWDDATTKPMRLLLPELHRLHRATVTMPARGLNANWVSESGRYLTLPLSLVWESGVATGDVFMVDLQERQLLWTGVTFSDGKRIQVEPTGRIASKVPESDRYIQYMIGYSHKRRVPLTALQFASRIGLSPTHRRLQELIDVGGTVVADQPLNDQNQRDSRDLPEPGRVKELHLVDCPYDLGDDFFSFAASLPALTKVDFNNSRVTLENLDFIRHAEVLQTLRVSGATVDNRIAAILPTNLQELDVSNTNVSDFLLYDLKRLKSLRKLNVSGTSVSQEAIDQLIEQLPNCQVVALEQ
ncbi:MAG: protein kinase [Pirellulaceae bacterium]